MVALWLCVAVWVCVGALGFFELLCCLLLEGSCLLIDREARPPGLPELRSCESMWVSGYVCCVSVYVGVCTVTLSLVSGCK